MTRSARPWPRAPWDQRHETIRQRTRGTSRQPRGSGDVPDRTCRAVVSRHDALARESAAAPQPGRSAARFLGHPQDRRIPRRSARHADRARGRLCDRGKLRGRRRLSHQPVAVSHAGVRAAVCRHLFGPASKIALGATIGFFPIALNTVAGFGYVDRVLVVAARSMGASDLQLFRYVLLPAALPIILTGMRMGFTVALLSIIGSETIASLAGLGHRIAYLAEAMEMAPMFAYIAFVVAIAAILNALVSALEARGKRP